MIRAISLAALALACVCSPAMAAECSLAPVAAKDWLWLAGFIALAFAYVAFDVWRTKRRADRESREWADFLRRLCWLACITCGAAALLLIGGAPAMAETVTVNGQPVVVFSWGPWVVAIAEIARDILVPVLTAALLAVVTKLYPLGRMFLSEALVERTLRKWFDYGINATAGATKDASVSIPVGAAVVANALQRGVDRADASAVSKWVMKEAGGEVEVARKLFRLLHLEEGADANAVVPKALEKAGVLPAAADAPAGPDLAARG
ncbi:hypothetical protein [Methylorubrum sp. SB2]|uniref:hypothetical protein n=1 Tax=Methylorubrum subtropicum TaxID=3138812 RepID=UPI00313C95CB